MDVQKIATYGTAVAVVGTGGIVGGGNVIDNMNDGPAKRKLKETTELRQIVREEVQNAFKDAWPTNTGGVKGMRIPSDYQNQIPKTAK
tara:strand:- start:250 stop:513 length:264 start_codon:yes stop_codon:yes gene_type:complete